MLRCDASDWGLTPGEYARRQKARLRSLVRARVQAERDMRPSVTAPSLVPSFGREVFETPHGPAYTVQRLQENGNGYSRNRVTLPYVSILGRPS